MTYADEHANNQVRNRAARRALKSKLVKEKVAKATLKAMRNAEDFIVVDPQRRSITAAIDDPKLVSYLVPPAAVEEMFADPRIDALVDKGVPVVLCFMRREDAVAVRENCRLAQLAQLAAMPAAGRA